jgi:hypothetical protein
MVSARSGIIRNYGGNIMKIGTRIAGYGHGVAALLLCALFTVSGVQNVQAGPVFLTGHDPDFHAQDSIHAKNFLTAGLSFVTNGTFDDGAASKFLWVESRIAVPSGHRVGEAGLTALGLTLGTNYERVNAAELATVNFSSYTAIAIASSFGGLLTRAELDGLIARSADIASFINGGGGLLALSECSPSSGFCDGSLLAGGTPPSPFGFLPVAVSSVATINSYHVTAAGAAAPFNLTDDDVNDPTHNSFGLTGGLTVLDEDAAGTPTTLAGNVRIGGGGFIPTVPEPTSMLLLGSGLAGLAVWRLRKPS